MKNLTAKAPSRQEEQTMCESMDFDFLAFWRFGGRY